MEDYIIISQTVDEYNNPIFKKVLRTSDDAIFEVRETKNKYGICYRIFFEGNDYRKMGIAFIKGEDIMPFKKLKGGKYKGPSGKVFNKKQVRYYYWTKGTWEKRTEKRK